MEKYFKKKGFTMFELMIVVSIFVILLAYMPQVYSSYFTSSGIKMARWEITNTLKRARLNTMTGREDVQWGVHFESDQYVLFKGTTYSSSDPDNEVHELLQSLDVTNISLNGGGADVVFNNVGSTDQYGSLQVESDASSNTVSVTINSAGTIDST